MTLKQRGGCWRVMVVYFCFVGFCCWFFIYS